MMMMMMMMLMMMMMMMMLMMLRRKTDPKTGKHTFCEPAQSKCTWTCHKRHFVRKFTRKMPDATDTISIEHRALTLTIRTPSVWPYCLGKKTLPMIGKQQELLYHVSRIAGICGCLRAFAGCLRGFCRAFLSQKASFGGFCGICESLRFQNPFRMP